MAASKRADGRPRPFWMTFSAWSAAAPSSRSSIRRLPSLTTQGYLISAPPQRPSNGMSEMASKHSATPANECRLLRFILGGGRGEAPPGTEPASLLFSEEAFDRLIARLMEQSGVYLFPSHHRLMLLIMGFGRNPRGEGLSETEMRQLRIIPFRRDEEARDCPICQDSFREDDQTILLPCEHRFHVDCLRPWLRRVASCPTCRKHPLPEQ